MIIRPATPTDSQPLAILILQAMEEIVYQFIGQHNYAAAMQLLQHFTGSDQNQYSYQHCWVAEAEGEIVAAINIYNGADLVRLREPVIQYIRAHFNAHFNPEHETQAGEYYIDTLAVLPQWQTQGIGTRLMEFVIEKYMGEQRQTLGLIVEEDNRDAKKLYLRLGFKPVGTKTLAGKQLEHLQLQGR